MSFRTLPGSADEAVALLRDIDRRLSALENGGAIRGQVSFDSVIQVGDVLISILDGVGNARTVQFKNALTGSTSIISLP